MAQASNISDSGWRKCRQLLAQVYPDSQVDWVIIQLDQLVGKFDLPEAAVDKLEDKFDQHDAALIIYPNSIVDPASNSKTLQVLNKFLQEFDLTQLLTVIHILPFYPWDTDRGFSVTDYFSVHPDYGSWADIKQLAKQSKLMFDFVLNHASIDNPLVQSSLICRHLPPDDPDYSHHCQYQDFVIAYSEEDKPSAEQLAGLVRPRPYPVLTPYLVYQTISHGQRQLAAILGTTDDLPDQAELLGTGWVWTSFSRPTDNQGRQTTKQVDLNYRNPKVLLTALEIMLFYIAHGASYLRLDAVGYMWKELGTSCLHHPKMHWLLRFMRQFLQQVAPGVVFIAEVNERFDKVLPYLGEPQTPESDLIYQFTHFPLALYSLFKHDPKLYADWYQTTQPANGRQFITVLGSHDGLGVKPLRGVLSPEEIQQFASYLVDRHQALPNHATLPGGQQIVYELCATAWQLVNPSDMDESLALRRYLMITALGLMLKGLPAIYINGLLGVDNYLPESGLDENRTVNRQIFDYQHIKQLLSSDSRQAQVMQQLKRLLQVRSHLPQLSPWQPLSQVGTQDSLLMFDYPAGMHPALLAIYNFDEAAHSLPISQPWYELVTGHIVQPGDSVPGYGFVWLSPINAHE